MNLLRKSIAAEFLHSSSSPRKCLFLLHSIAAQQQQSSSYSTSYTCTSTTRLKKQPKQNQTPEKPSPVLPEQPPLASTSSSEMVQKKPPMPGPVRQNEREVELHAVDWPRPSVIPWQTKVANSVNLIGRVQIPVKFQAFQDGKYWAGTIISQNQDGNYETGTSSSESPPFWIAIIFEGDLAHIAACHLKEKDLVYIDGQLTADPPPFTIGNGHANVQVLVNGINFVEGYFQLKKSFADSKKQQGTNNSARKKKEGDPALSFWRDLIENSTQWRDYREKKLKGLVKPKHPDFKHKDSGQPLWLNSAPEWVLSGLEGLEFDVQPRIVEQVKEFKGVDNAPASRGDDSWKKLVANPDKWWDNRSDKINVKSPDFKHKDTGEALWLSDSPAWVLPRLPPLKAKQNVAFARPAKPYEKENSYPRSQ